MDIDHRSDLDLADTFDLLCSLGKSLVVSATYLDKVNPNFCGEQTHSSTMGSVGLAVLGALVGGGVGGWKFCAQLSGCLDSNKISNC